MEQIRAAQEAAGTCCKTCRALDTRKETTLSGSISRKPLLCRLELLTHHLVEIQHPVRVMETVEAGAEEVEKVMGRAEEKASVSTPAVKALDAARIRRIATGKP